MPRLRHFSWPLLTHPHILPMNSCSLTRWPECVSTFHKPREPQLRQPRNHDNEVFSKVVLFNLRWSIITPGCLLIHRLSHSLGNSPPQQQLEISPLGTHTTRRLSLSLIFHAVVLNPGCTLESLGEPEDYGCLGPSPSDLGGTGCRAPWDILIGTRGWEPP